MRPSWPKIWMDFARAIAERSVDPRMKVGAVVVTEDNGQVLSLGYNGDHAGGPNEVESTEPGQSGFIHAEINALIKMDFNNFKSKTMYVTVMPCRMCAKAIVNARIDKVVYASVYRDTSGLDILTQSGIHVEEFKDSLSER